MIEYHDFLKIGTCSGSDSHADAWDFLKKKSSDGRPKQKLRRRQEKKPRGPLTVGQPDKDIPTLQRQACQKIAVISSISCDLIKDL
ncbi:MAG: hypothetical protein ACQCXQ_00430 [Verrucomicrobiales bacterium]|nr:hypothetical protein [Verrucomicrobiota bacterium JB025]